MIRERTGAEVALTAGKVGQFDVVADGKLVFSKKAEGRFPEPEEVLNALSQ